MGTTALFVPFAVTSNTYYPAFSSQDNDSMNLLAKLSEVSLN
jgi:hypothetical protein